MQEAPSYFRANLIFEYAIALSFTIGNMQIYGGESPDNGLQKC